MYVVLVVCEAIDPSSRLMGMSGVTRGNAAREAVCFALLLQGRGCRFVTDSHALLLCTVAKAALLQPEQTLQIYLKHIY
jgi:hypothetical protein